MKALTAIIILKVFLIFSILLFLPYEIKLNNITRLANEILFIIISVFLKIMENQNQDLKKMEIIPN
jgi:hypothetical protein